LEVVKALFNHNCVFQEVHENCKAAVVKFLGFSEPKSFLSGSVVRKLTLAFSSYAEIMDIDFSDSGVSSLIGKDVLRLFQATLGVPILDVKYPKASHLGYLAHTQSVVKGEEGVSSMVGCTMGDIVPVDVSNRNRVTGLPLGHIGGWTLSLPDEDAVFYETASD